jgi:uncharacterized short protein YbdD (DUF466 family)
MNAPELMIGFHLLTNPIKLRECWDDDELAAKVVGDGASALDSVRRYVEDMREKHPESKPLYAAYNLIEGLELAWGTRNQPLAV